MFQLYLAHNPDYLYALQTENALLLAGHFHGGQICLPFAPEFRWLRKERLGKEGIHRGAHQLGNCHLVLSRGLGCVLLPFRFLSPPELSLYLLSLSEEDAEA